MATTRLGLKLLGAFEARFEHAAALTFPTRKSQVVIAYLALKSGHRVPREALARLLWPRVTEDRARSSLRQNLSVLRRVLAGGVPPVLLIDNLSIRLEADAVDVDVARFERLVRESTPASLERAVNLYRGDFLEGLSVREHALAKWITAERERLRALVASAMDRLLAGNAPPQVAIEVARRLLGVSPQREDVHRVLMALYARQGRWGAALRQFQECRMVIQREFGTEPEPATRDLYEQILRQRTHDDPTSPSVLLPALPPARLRKRTRTAARRRAAPLSGAPLVGRTLERARLRVLLSDVEQGHGSTVAVLGAAGIGKTRLIEQISEDAFRLRMRVLVGRCYETEQTLPLRPLVDALQRGQIVAEIDRLHGLHPVWRNEIRLLFPDLGTPEGGSDVESAQRFPRLIEAIAHVFEVVAAHQPLVLVIEDAHWGDEFSLRTLAFLSHRIADWAMMIVLTTRSNEAATAPLLTALLQEAHHEGHLVSLRLDALTQRETHALVRGLGRLHGVPGAVERWAEKIWQTSEGHPLIAVETFRALDAGEVGLDDLGVRLPLRVHHLLAQRLQRLSAPARDLVAAAAVTTARFDLVLLRKVTGLTDDVVAAAGEELIQGEVWTGVEQGLDFTHQRLRQVAYAELSSLRKTWLHGRVAEAIEALRAEDLVPHYGTLALHWSRAERWDKAVLYARIAGGRAFVFGSHREAAAAFGLALTAVGHLPEGRETLAAGIDLRLDLQLALFPMGELAEMERVLREAHDMAERLGDRRRLGRVSAYRAAHCWWTAAYGHGLDACRHALEIASEIDEPALRLTAWFHEALIQHGRGDYARAATLLTQMQPAADGGLTSQRFTSTDFTVVYATTALARTLGELGDLAEAARCAAAATQVAERNHHPVLLASAYLTEALVALARLDPGAAVIWLERARSVVHAADIRLYAPAVEVMLPYARTMAGGTVTEADLSADLIPRPAYYSSMLAWRAETQLRTGNLDAAASVASDALAAARAREENGAEGWIERLLGDIAMRRTNGDLGEAGQRYRRAFEIAEARNMRPLAMHCHHGLARIAQRRGHAPEARDHQARAVQLAGEMGIAQAFAERTAAP